MSKKTLSILVIIQFILIIVGFLYIEFKTQNINVDYAKIGKTWIANNEIRLSDYSTYSDHYEHDSLKKSDQTKLLSESKYAIFGKEMVGIENTSSVLYDTTEVSSIFQPSEGFQINSNKFTFYKKGYDSKGIRYNMTKIISIDTTIVELEIDTNFKFDKKYEDHQGKFNNVIVPSGTKITYLSR